MEYNRNNQNRHYQGDFHRTPYERGPPRGRGGNYRSSEGNFRRDDNFKPRGNRFTPREGNFEPHRDNFMPREDNFRPREDNSRFHGDQNWRVNSSRSRGNYNNFKGHSQNRWQNPERTFDDSGREVGNYENPSFFDSHDQRNRPGSSSSYNHAAEQEVPANPMLTPLEEKAKDFLHTVLRQEGVRSKLIFLETVESALQTLQGTVDYCQLQMTIDPDSTGEFILKIDKEELARGTFPNKQMAKTSLAEQAMEILKKDCFYIIKKKVYEEITTKKGDPKVEAKPQADFQGSKAHQMMLKMGWGGKGLGVNEQGAEKTVAETLDQNVSRQGLGTDDVFKKIHKLLEDYSKSDKISLLRFDPDFTSEERAHIHKIAAKFGLKSKSEGKGEQRRITITKKLYRGDLVYNLLISDLENTLYKLMIPGKFAHLWHDDEDDE